MGIISSVMYLIVRDGESQRREFSLFAVIKRFPLGAVTVHREVLVLSALVPRRFPVLAAAASRARAQVFRRLKVLLEHGAFHIAFHTSTVHLVFTDTWKEKNRGH